MKKRDWRLLVIAWFAVPWFFGGCYLAGRFGIVWTLKLFGICVATMVWVRLYFWLVDKATR